MAKKVTAKKGPPLKERLNNFFKTSQSLTLTDWDKIRHDPKLLQKMAAPMEVDLSEWQPAIKAYKKRRKKDAWNRQKPVKYDTAAIRKVYEIKAEILRKQGIFDEMQRIASIQTVKKEHLK